MTYTRPTIVCLCGSTRFHEAFQQANCEETLAGRIVLSVGFFGHSAETAHGGSLSCTPEQKLRLDDLHLRKIDLADEILVLNVDGYVGESTTREIAYAAAAGKKIRWVLPDRIPAHLKPLIAAVEAAAREATEDGLE